MRVYLFLWLACDCASQVVLGFALRRRIQRVAAPNGWPSIVRICGDNWACRSRHFDKSVADVHCLSEGTDGDENRNEIASAVHRIYRKFLEYGTRKPVLTKAIAASIIAGFGDVLSQVWEADNSHEGVLAVLDLRRLCSFVLMGLLVEGPYIHFWYELLWVFGSWLEKRLDRESSRVTTFVQILLDQTVGVAIFFPAYFYIFECVESIVFLRVPRIALAHAQCVSRIGDVWRTQYYVWPIANWIIFRSIPRPLRVTCSNLVAVAWSAYLHSQVVPG